MINQIKFLHKVQIMQGEKENFSSNDLRTNAQTPIIISASHSTDILTFYGDWFVDRWRAGYIKYILIGINTASLLFCIKKYMTYFSIEPYFVYIIVVDK